MTFFKTIKDKKGWIKNPSFFCFLKELQNLANAKMLGFYTVILSSKMFSFLLVVYLNGKRFVPKNISFFFLFLFFDSLIRFTFSSWWNSVKFTFQLISIEYSNLILKLHKRLLGHIFRCIVITNLMIHSPYYNCTLI